MNSKLPAAVLHEAALTRAFKIVLPLLILLSITTKGFGQAFEHSDTLAKHFQTPSDQYGIRCWWWWLNGNVTKEAITSDLEQMKGKGFSGACIVDAGGQNQFGNSDVPEGPLFGSAAWMELYLHALKESQRLGLKLSLNIQSGWNVGGPGVKPEDAAKHLTWSEQTITGPSDNTSLTIPPTRAGLYKDIVVLAFKKKKNLTREPITNLELKSAFREGHRSGVNDETVLHDIDDSPGEADVDARHVIVLNNKLDASGKLNWRVPPGKWTILRFGYTLSDAHISTSSGQWHGHVIDYMDANAFHNYWTDNVKPILDASLPYLRSTLQYLQTDSWELGGINWTKNFAEEFKRRRGYDVFSYLPVIAGKIVSSRTMSNAFLADFRKTIGECIAAYHYKVFADHAAQYGLGIHAESAGPHAGPFDGLTNYGFNEVMMSEFWSPSPHRSTDDERFFVKQAASAAKIYGKSLVAAESFTTIGRHWNDTPWLTMKPAFDREVCSGLNMVFLHTFTCSPAAMGKPGQEYFAGTHLNPNITWWEFSTEVFDYMKRCQYLLQNTESFADVLYYNGDHVPNIADPKHTDPAAIFPGFDFDFINETKLLELTVKNNKITIPGGATYRILVLPDVPVLSMKALKKVKQLVSDGATVVGDRPLSSMSLTPKEKRFAKICTLLWTNNNTSVSKRNNGVIGGTNARTVLTETLKLQPDVAFRGNGTFDYIHRVHESSGLDLYFISNQNPDTNTMEVRFRITDRYPELFDPLSGEVKEIPAITKDNTTSVQLKFEPYGSAFVVFRKRGSVSNLASTPTLRPVHELTGPWTVTFDSSQYKSHAFITDTLINWKHSNDSLLRYYSGKGIYTARFRFAAKENAKRYYLRLNSVEDVGIAKVFINGSESGITWTPPFRVEITNSLREGLNDIRVEVINSWRNRLVGDRNLDPSTRYTKTNITIRPEWKLLDAGLLGPVAIEVAD